MKATERVHISEGDFRAFRASNADDGLVFFWLGQAGFAFRYKDAFFLIDPYLSDHLAVKYKGKEFPHLRMMQPPIAPGELVGVKAVLCSHRHSDHMDPLALPEIAKNNPACRFVVPRAESDAAAGIGLPRERLVTVNSEECVEPVEGVRVTCVPSAHEEIKTNADGEHHFLGFIVRINGGAVYHSGDTVPYDGLAARLREEHIDVAMLPINGRDAHRRERNVPGNMNFDEAVALCRDAEIPALIPHHFGMFEFNTVDPGEIRTRIRAMDHGLQCVLPDMDHFYRLV